MALTIGITGGIGSGKTTVCNVFKLMGVPVFEADMIAGQIMDTNRELQSEISALFGNDICNCHGLINKKKLAGIVFKDQAQLEKLNKLVHPAVRDEFLKWSDRYKNFPYIIMEAAILLESGFHKLADFTILVTAPEDERIIRVMKRDGVTLSSVRNRISKQYPESKKEEMADLVLYNDNNHLIIPEIIKIDKKIREYGKIW
jgi:dephospho-CoA kinase